MAEVVNMPKSVIDKATLTRETSSLNGPLKKTDKPAIEKVELKGTVTAKKPSFTQKLKDTFIAEDARDVGDYILWDILVPTIKRTIRDVIVGSADRIFLGTSSQPTSNLYKERGVTYVKRTDYGAIASRKSTIKSLPAAGTSSRSNFHLDEMVFEQYEDASAVLDRMVDYLETYGKVSVDDFFDLIGRSSNYTAQNWGWTSLANATIVNTVGGYFIKLPNPVVIKE